MKVDGVRLYPGGGLLCQKVESWEVMSVLEALKELTSGRPACIWLDNLHIILTYLRPEPIDELITVRVRSKTIYELETRQLARAGLETSGVKGDP